MTFTQTIHRDYEILSRAISTLMPLYRQSILSHTLLPLIFYLDFFVLFLDIYLFSHLLHYISSPLCEEALQEDLFIYYWFRDLCGIIFVLSNMLSPHLPPLESMFSIINFVPAFFYFLLSLSCISLSSFLSPLLLPSLSPFSLSPPPPFSLSLFSLPFLSPFSLSLFSPF